MVRQQKQNIVKNLNSPDFQIFKKFSQESEKSVSQMGLRLSNIFLLGGRLSEI